MTIKKLETEIIHILKNIDYKEKGRNGVGYDFWKLQEIVTLTDREEKNDRRTSKGRV
jgi:uncharacterized protein (UPF0335 family)